MDVGIPPLRMKTQPEPNPLKSRALVRRLDIYIYIYIYVYSIVYIYIYICCIYVYIHTCNSLSLSLSCCFVARRVQTLSCAELGYYHYYNYCYYYYYSGDLYFIVMYRTPYVCMYVCMYIYIYRERERCMYFVARRVQTLCCAELGPNGRWSVQYSILYYTIL